MNTRARNWPSLTLWFILAVSAGWTIYLLAANYGSCRADRHGQLVRFILAPLFTCIAILMFVVSTAVRILTSILP